MDDKKNSLTKKICKEIYRDISEEAYKELTSVGGPAAYGFKRSLIDFLRSLS